MDIQKNSATLHSHFNSTMMGRKGRSGGIRDDQLSADGSVLSYMGLGRDGISLDGESVKLPGDPDFVYIGQDELSSIGKSLDGEGAVAATYFRSVPNGNAVMHARGKTAVGEEEDNPLSGRGGGSGGCCPSWTSAAHPWLKGAIVFSSILLFSSLVLVIVAAGMAKSEKSISATSSTGTSSFGLGSNFPPAAPVDQSSFPPVAPVSRPTSAPGKLVVQTALPTRKPKQSPTSTLPPFAAPTVSPSSVPSQLKNDRSDPSAAPTVSPSSVPSQLTNDRSDRTKKPNDKSKDKN